MVTRRQLMLGVAALAITAALPEPPPNRRSHREAYMGDIIVEFPNGKWYVAEKHEDLANPVVGIATGSGGVMVGICPEPTYRVWGHDTAVKASRGGGWRIGQAA